MKENIEGKTEVKQADIAAFTTACIPLQEKARRQGAYKYKHEVKFMWLELTFTLVCKSPEDEARMTLQCWLKAHATTEVLPLLPWQEKDILGTALLQQQ